MQILTMSNSLIYPTKYRIGEGKVEQALGYICSMMQSYNFKPGWATK